MPPPSSAIPLSSALLAFALILTPATHSLTCVGQCIGFQCALHVSATDRHREDSASINALQNLTSSSDSERSDAPLSDRGGVCSGPGSAHDVFGCQAQQADVVHLIGFRMSRMRRGPAQRRARTFEGVFHRTLWVIQCIYQIRCSVLIVKSLAWTPFFGNILTRFVENVCSWLI